MSFARRAIGRCRYALIGDAGKTRRVLEQRYFDFLGRWPNLNHPITFREKLLWLNLFYRNPLIPPLTDKWLARAVVAKRAGPEVLNEVYGVWDRVDEIPFDELPQQFVLKVTAGSGWNILCRDRTKLDIAETIAQLRKWQNENYYYRYREWQYRSLKRRIIAERLMVDPVNPALSTPDYKFFSFNGQPRVVGVSSDRFGDTRHDFFDCDWNPVDYGMSNKPTSDIPLKRPDDLLAMVDIVRKLSAGFPFVRVDLYRHQGQIIFGEMTWHPAAGNITLLGPGADETWGSWLTLPAKS